MFGEIEVVLGMLVVVLAFMGLFGFVGWWLTKAPKVTNSPYTGMPLQRAELLPYETRNKVARYLDAYHQYDNRPFRFKKAAYCRETGRLFPDCVNWIGQIEMDWSFLQKRHPGNWISWGSLSDELKVKIRNRHEDLAGFQSTRSSIRPSPRQVEPTFSYLKPGPLYVDIDTGILLGWKEVPNTEMEVLIVQKPIR